MDSITYIESQLKKVCPIQQMYDSCYYTGHILQVKQTNSMTHVLQSLF